MTRDKRSSVVFLLTFAAALFCSAISAEASDREEVLRRSAHFFGNPIDEKLSLFEVNRFYVLHVSFDKRGKLEELAVEPKYVFEEEHPEWKQTDDFACLSKLEFEDLLESLETIKKKGKLIKPASDISYVTNMTAWHTEVYRHARLTWGELADIRRGDDAPYEVRWFRLNFGKRK